MKDCDTDNIYVVDKYYNSYQANIARALLADHGIKSEVINEEINILYPLSYNDNFCTKLIANIEDRDKITEILNSEFEKNAQI